MDTRARTLFTEMLAAMALTYGVKDVSHEFAAVPTIEQKLMDKITLSSAFLQKINVMPVRDLAGEKILGSVSGVIGKRTNTASNDRVPSNPLALDEYGYTCKKTEYDTLIPYATIDSWSKFPDLYERYMKYVRKAAALARIKIGFYGTSAATATDPVTYPNGNDVNIGWLQHLRAFNSGAQFLLEGSTEDQIRIGHSTGDYPNLDALVHDILQMISEVHRDGDDLVAIIGRDLLTLDKAQLYVAQGQTPTEKERLENNAVVRTYGGLPAVTVPNFPSRGLMITSFDNLSIYYQEGSVRQKIEDNAKRDRIEHYTSINDAYVVEDLEKAASIEFANVRLWNGSAFA